MRPKDSSCREKQRQMGSVSRSILKRAVAHGVVSIRENDALHVEWIVQNEPLPNSRRRYLQGRRGWYIC